MIKLIGLFKRKEGITREEFLRYWEEKHGPLAAKVVPGMKRYMQSHVLNLPGSKEPMFDAVTEIWFDDRQAQKAAAAFYQSEEGKVIRDDEAKFIDMRSIVFLITEEKVIKE